MSHHGETSFSGVVAETVSGTDAHSGRDDGMEEKWEIAADLLRPAEDNMDP